MSVILGFAAQTTLGNLVAGISLILYKPFRRGDRLQIQAPTGLETGAVEDISLGYTVLRTDDDRRVIIANTTMAQQTMIKLAPSSGTAEPLRPSRPNGDSPPASESRHCHGSELGRRNRKGYHPAFNDFGGSSVSSPRNEDCSRSESCDEEFGRSDPCEFEGDPDRTDCRRVHRDRNPDRGP